MKRRRCGTPLAADAGTKGTRFGYFANKYGEQTI